MNKISGTQNKYNSINTATIGIVGVTIPGAADCFNKINQQSHIFYPNYEHPTVIIHQLNFGPTHDAQIKNRWDIVEDRLLESINALQKAGADFVIIPSNTVHKVIDSLQKRSPLFILSMLDVVADECLRLGLKNVAILGTSWTMAEHLYRESLKTRGINELVPSGDDQKIIQNAIFAELVPTGKTSLTTLDAVIGVVNRLKSQGCDSIALACTELPLILNSNNCDIAVLDTTELLARAAVQKSKLGR